MYIQYTTNGVFWHTLYNFGKKMEEWIVLTQPFGQKLTHTQKKPQQNSFDFHKLAKHKSLLIFGYYFHKGFLAILWEYMAPLKQNLSKSKICMNFKANGSVISVCLLYE